MKLAPKYPSYTPSQRRWFWFVNAISASRFATPFILIFWYYPAVKNSNVASAAWAIGIATVLTAGDAIDGWLAGQHGVKSQLGNYLDHVSDKCTLFTALAIWFVLLLTANDNQSWVYNYVFATLGLAVLVEGYIAIINAIHRDSTTGANGTGRHKYAVQGAAFAVAAIAITGFYHDPSVMKPLTLVSGVLLWIGLLMGITSALEYRKTYSQL